MKVERVHNGIRYTLSNENLCVGDKVYPIASGRCLGNHDWILHDFSFKDYCSGFPDEPHTILDLHYSDSKPYQVRTDYGYGPIEIYYKIIKREQKVAESEKPFTHHKWVEI